jgi:hypothetical protein
MSIPQTDQIRAVLPCRPAKPAEEDTLEADLLAAKQLMLESHDFQLALTLLKKYENVNNPNVEAYLAICYQKLQKPALYETSLGRFEAWYQSHRHNPKANLIKIYLEYSLMQDEEALMTAQHCHNNKGLLNKFTEPEKKELYFWLGILAYNQIDLEETSRTNQLKLAEEYLLKSLDQLEENTPAGKFQTYQINRYLGMIYFSLGDYCSGKEQADYFATSAKYFDQASRTIPNPKRACEEWKRLVTGPFWQESRPQYILRPNDICAPFAAPANSELEIIE